MDNFELQIRQASQTGTPLGACLSYDELDEFYARPATEDRAAEIRQHLASCAACLEAARDLCSFLGLRPETEIVADFQPAAWYARPGGRIAATVVLVAGLAAAWSVTRNPAENLVVRSAQVEPAIAVVSPQGELAAVPSLLEWQPFPNGNSYDVELRDVRLNIIWNRQQVVGTKLEIPVEVQNQMKAGAGYAWRVFATTSEGHRVSSAFTPFLIRAQAEVRP